MSDLQNLLDALEDLVGKRVAAPLRWKYEQAKARGIILLPPPHPFEAYGEIQLGEVIWNNEIKGIFGLYDIELPQHIGIFGRTGAGKTNCAFLLLQRLLSMSKPFLVFDWKQTYRPLAKQHNLTLATPGHCFAPFSLNPFDLSNIPAQLHDAYLRHLLSVIMNTYLRELRLLSVEGAEYLLLRAIDSLHNQRPLFTLKDIYLWILQYQGSAREKDWKSTVLNVLYKLTTGPIGLVLNNTRSIDISRFINTNTIIELGWLGSPNDKAFLMQLVLLQLYYHFSQLPPSKKTRFMVLVEEAHNILLEHKGSYETVVEMVLRQIREYGVSLCLIDQHPSLMSLPALGTFCTIAFNLRSPKDTDLMASSLCVNEPEYFSSLRTGQAIVKIQDRYLKPFLVNFDKADVPPDCGDIFNSLASL